MIFLYSLLSFLVGFLIGWVLTLIVLVEIENRRRIDPETAVKQIERRVYHSSEEHSSYLSHRFIRGTIAGTPFIWQGHVYAYRYTSFDDDGPYDLIFRNRKET